MRGAFLSRPYTPLRFDAWAYMRLDVIQNIPVPVSNTILKETVDRIPARISHIKISASFLTAEHPNGP